MFNGCYEPSTLWDLTCLGKMNGVRVVKGRDGSDSQYPGNEISKV